MEPKPEIVFKVLVDRTQDPMEALLVTNCEAWIDSDAVQEMPGSGNKKEEVEPVFFSLEHLDQGANEEKLEEEYILRKFLPADPFVLAAFNKLDPSFLINHKNGTHWKNGRGKWCICRFYFDKSRKERRVDLGPRNPYRLWEKGWWFAGVRIS